MNETPKKDWSRFEKLRSRKQVKRSWRKIESASLKHAHRFVIKRWQNVREVRRHALGWLLLAGVLISAIVLQTVLFKRAYQVAAPAEKGTYSEGVLGQFDQLNPIYAVTQPERSAAKLLFAGLLTYDSRGSLKNDLAQSISVSQEGRRYQVTLKPKLEWDDGQPITSKDVAFTFASIKNDSSSPYYRSWRDIKLTVLDSRRIQFDLPGPYAPFPHSLTVGILPAHALSGISATDLRNASFNSNPVSSGPFSFRSKQTINAEKGRFVIHMVANEKYHAGRVKLDRFQLHIYDDRNQLKRAFVGGEISAVADFTAQDLTEIDRAGDYKLKNIPLNNVAMAIFKTDSDILKDIKVRQALRLALDRSTIVKDALNGQVTLLDTPIPPSLTGETGLTQPNYDFSAADQLLTQAGWVRDSQGRRAKDGLPLRLMVATRKTGDYPKVLEAIVAQWSKLGIVTDTVLADPEDIQQTIITPRAYDVLVDELAISGDPDVYAYWHSSQANARGLNLANYSSGKADDALSTARSRFELDLRSAKYRTFMEQWLADVPAVVLYQPNLHYISRTPIGINGDAALVDSVDRYRDVQYWYVTETPQNRTP